jgi:tRNA(adenine34) deaminase
MNARAVWSNHMPWMREALAEAAKAAAQGDVPIGAVAVCNGQVIGRGHNRREADGDPTAHAEMIAVREAARAVGTWWLDGVVLYSTLEPCAMCAGAIVLARLPRLVWAADDPKAGACGSALEVLNHPRLNHHVEVLRGVLADEAAAQLRDFFAGLRSP